MRNLRPYQIKGKHDIFKLWETDDVAMYVLATGGGKTVTFTEVIREFVMRGQNAWLIAHREELITQSWQTLYDAKIMAGIVKGSEPTAYNLQAQVMSIQTIGRRKHLPPAPALIVIDEGHHVTEINTYGRILNLYPEAKVLIVTATPYRLSGDGFTSIVEGKETKLILGGTLKELIESGWLVPLKYHIGGSPNMENVDIEKGDYNDEQTADAMGMVPLVESYLMHCNGEQGLCFCVNVAHSIQVADKYNRAGISAVHIDANTPLEQRKEVLTRFKRKEILVVCNVGIFTEGTDFPNCQFVQLAAPTKSLSKLFQMVGRGTRALPGIVDRYETAQERINAIAQSGKPLAKVLDNAGMWKEHPFADEDIDWLKYFNGWRAEKKKKNDDEPEFIEIPIYEVEDPETGARKKTKNIEEVEGMVLIEITHEMRKNLRAMKHLQEFDRLYKIGKESNKIEKPGYFAYFKFREFCDGQAIPIEDIAWKYLREKLVDDVDKKINDYLAAKQTDGRVAIPSINSEVEKMRLSGVHKYFLKTEYEGYKQGIRKPPTVAK